MQIAPCCGAFFIAVHKGMDEEVKPCHRFWRHMAMRGSLRVAGWHRLTFKTCGGWAIGCVCVAEFGE